MLNLLSRYRQKRYIESLVKKGLVLGEKVFLNDGFFIDPAHCHLIRIDNNVVFGPRVTILAHDASSLKVIGKTLISSVVISQNVFIGANATILPGVTIGENSIIGAGSVVTKSVPPQEVWVGTPAARLCSVSDYSETLRKKKAHDFLYAEYKQSSLNEEKIKEQREAIKRDGFAFMKSK